jgi:hypothetical protein
MLEQFRLRQFRKSLTAALSAQKRKRTVHTLETAKRIGLLFDATNEAKRREVSALSKTLVQRGKTVQLLGFINVKNPVENIDFEHFTAKEVSWFHQVKSEKALRFARENFDLLLCINPDGALVVDWLAVSSQAAMKIGIATEQTNDYDVQLDIPAGKNLDFFISQLETYLNTLTNVKKNAPKSAV